MEKIKEYIKNALNNAENHHNISVNQIVTNCSKKKIEAILKRKIDNFFLVANDIRHTYNKHKNDSTKTKKQKSLTINDLLKLPEIIANPDNIILGVENAKNGSSIKFIKKLEDGTMFVVFVECFFSDNELQQKTGYKKKPLDGTPGKIAIISDFYCTNSERHKNMKTNILEGFGDFIRSLKTCKKSKALNGAWSDDKEKFKDELLKQLNDFISCKWEKPWTPGYWYDKNDKPVLGKYSIYGNCYSSENEINLTGKFPPVDSNMPYYATADYVEKQGGKIAKNAKNYFIVSRFVIDKIVDETTIDKETNEKETKSGLRRISGKKVTIVYNVQDIQGIKYPELTRHEYQNNELNKYVESVILQFKNLRRVPKMVDDEPEDCYYMPKKDEIHHVPFKFFKKMDEYYSTLFHEIVHSTKARKIDGNPVRKGFEGGEFGSKGYASEELVAEFGAFILCSEMGLSYTRQNSVAYLNNWSKAIPSTERDNIILEAYAQACDAVDFLLKDIDIEKSITKAVKKQKIEKQLSGTLFGTFAEWEHSEYDKYFKVPADKFNRAAAEWTKTHKEKKISLYDIASDDPLRPALNCIFYENNCAIVSDYHAMAVINYGEWFPKQKDKLGKLIDRDGKEVNGRYVDYKSVIPKDGDDDWKETNIDLKRLYQSVLYLSKCKAINKGDIFLRYELTPGYFFPLKCLAKMIRLISSLGDYYNMKLYIKDSSSPLCLKNKTGIFFIMPIMPPVENYYSLVHNDIRYVDCPFNEIHTESDIKDALEFAPLIYTNIDGYIEITEESLIQGKICETDRDMDRIRKFRERYGGYLRIPTYESDESIILELRKREKRAQKLLKELNESYQK